MMVILENTTRLVEFRGVKCRVWEGKSGNGVPVFALIANVAVPAAEDQAEFERELRETRAPSNAAVEAFPLRMVL